LIFWFCRELKKEIFENPGKRVEKRSEGGRKRERKGAREKSDQWEKKLTEGISRNGFEKEGKGMQGGVRKIKKVVEKKGEHERRSLGKEITFGTAQKKFKTADAAPRKGGTSHPKDSKKQENQREVKDMKERGRGKGQAESRKRKHRKQPRKQSTDRKKGRSGTKPSR